MKKGVIILGPSAAGKTTLGRKLADKLNVTYLDIDDYIWRNDTDIAYTVMYSKEEKISRLMSDVDKVGYFVMAGSMSSFHTNFDPLFEYAVFVDCDINTRIIRADKRGYERFGEAIRKPGAIKEVHDRLIDSIPKYETDGSPNRVEQMQWCETLRGLGCEVLKVDGTKDTDENVEFLYEIIRKKRLKKQF